MSTPVGFLLDVLVQFIIEVLFYFLTIYSPFRLMRKLCLGISLREQPEGIPRRIGLWLLDGVSWAALVIGVMQTFRLAMYRM